MTNPIDETERLYEELQSISNQIEAEIALEQIAEQSIIELKRIDMQPIFDEYYGASVCGEVLEKGAKKPALRDPKGGLTAAGRAYFKRKEGANLKPGVQGAADTPQKMRRKGSFLTRFFTNPSGPMKDSKGRSTRLALSAAAWGEPVPQNMDDARKLAAKGRRLLERYENTKKKKSDSTFDVFNKTAESNFFSTVSDFDLEGIVGEYGILEIGQIDTEAEVSLRAAAREELLRLSPSGKSYVQYVPEDDDSRKRMSRAAKMMAKRRKTKSKNG
jgi:hypothetical protein